VEQIIQYFSTIPSSHRSAILIGGLTFFFLIESAIPLFHFNFDKKKHTGINLFFTLTTVIINFFLAGIILKLSDYLVANKIGLLYLIELPNWAFALIGLMILDLVGAWLAHYLEHTIKWMWMFHLIHHSDPLVDTTTANRHHPGESVIRVFFTIIAVAITGAPMWLVMMYQSLSVILSQFNHANIRLPKSIDKAMSWIIISPDMHKVHHHYKMPLTNTNYGNIFAFWDRIFGTFAEVENPLDIKYGIDTYPLPEEHSDISALLKIPFQPYRPPTQD